MPLYDCAGGNGGGGGGTSDYEQLSNLPQVNNNILIGNKSASDLGLVGAVAGKGLSTNDYTNTDKAIVDGVTSALAGKVDKVTGKGLSTNDYDNTAKGIVDGVTSALAGKVDTSLLGSSNGVAELDTNGRVPSSQLPSYVDDVLDYADLAHFPATGETGKIYIADDTNKEYRWSGSGYAVISESLALGETSSTAYAGNKGKANADAIAAIKDGTNIDSFADVESAISAVDGKIAYPTISSGSANDIKGENVQVSKTNNYLIDTLLTSSSTSDADKVTIEWDGNNDVVRFRNYINNVKVKETTFVSSDFIDISSNVTVDSHITLTNNNLTLQKIGKMVFVNLMFTTTAEIPVYTKIIDNIPYSPIVNSQGIQVFKQSSKDAFILTIARNSGTNTCYIATLDTIPTSTSVRSVLPISVGN